MRNAKAVKKGCWALCVGTTGRALTKLADGSVESHRSLDVPCAHLMFDIPPPPLLRPHAVLSVHGIVPVVVCVQVDIRTGAPGQAALPRLESHRSWTCSEVRGRRGVVASHARLQTRGQRRRRRPSPRHPCSKGGPVTPASGERMHVRSTDAYVHVAPHVRMFVTARGTTCRAEASVAMPDAATNQGMCRRVPISPF